MSRSRFDKEYSTQWILEKQFLESKGIRYEFVKTIDGIDTFKYKKTVELFEALVEFYSQVYYK